MSHRNIRSGVCHLQGGFAVRLQSNCVDNRYEGLATESHFVMVRSPASYLGSILCRRDVRSSSVSVGQMLQCYENYIQILFLVYADYFSKEPHFPVGFSVHSSNTSLHFVIISATLEGKFPYQHIIQPTTHLSPSVRIYQSLSFTVII